jgi:hypothetical protein
MQGESRNQRVSSGPRTAGSGQIAPRVESPGLGPVNRIRRTGLVRAFVLLTLLAAFLLLAAQPAMAELSYNGAPTVFDAGHVAATASGGSWISVDDSDGGSAGDIYVPVGATVGRFTSAAAQAGDETAGSQLTGFLFAATAAVDPNDGDVYVADILGGIKKYDRDGNPLTFAIDPTLAPVLSTPLAVAVNPVNGNVLAANFQDSEAPIVYEMDSSGASTGTIYLLPKAVQFEEVKSIAVSSAGTVYIAAGPGGTRVFSSPGFVSSVLATKPDGSPVRAEGVAVSPLHEEVFVASPDHVSAYGSDGAQIGQSFGGGTLSAASGVGVDADSTHVYVADVGTGDAYVFQARNLPGVVTGAASDLQPAKDGQGGSVRLNGTVSPDGEAVTDCEFEYGTDPADYENTVPCAQSSGAIGVGDDPVPVTVDVSGLDPDIYHFRLAAANGEGRAEGNDESFVLQGSPTILSEAAGEATQHEVELRARIAPNNAATEYRFEYGTGAGPMLVTPTETLPASNEPTAVHVPVSGLAPGSIYTFRVRLTNAVGAVDGAFERFTTPPLVPSDGCPNAAVRAREGISSLVGCRAYEQVSPVEKGNAPVTMPFTSLAGRADGSAIIYSTEAQALPDSGSLPIVPRVLAERGPDGWASQTLDPPTSNQGGPPGANTLFRTVIGASDDLTRELVVSRRALAAGGVEGDGNVYIYDTHTRSYTFVATSPGAALTVGLTGPQGGIDGFLGGTSDFSTVAFATSAQLLPEAPSGETSAYVWSESGGLRLAGPGGNSGVTNLHDPHYLSADGSSLFYVTHGQAVVHVNQAGVDRTISSPQSQFSGATEDGRYAMYQTGNDLFRWSAATGNSELVDDDVTTTFKVFPRTGAAYFKGTGEELFYLHDGVTEALGRLGPATLMSFASSPDDRYLLFATPFRVTDYDNAGFEEAYLFDSHTGEVSCVSCRPDGKPPVGGVQIGQEEGGNTGGFDYRVPFAVNDQGEAFFDTADALSPRDGNGVRDVYGSRDGKVWLVTPGTQAQPALLKEVSPDGSDVFFSTPARLVGQDRDNLPDLYDARVEGGLLAQNPAPATQCAGASCRGAVAATATALPPGSESMAGPGNVPPAARKGCPKGRVTRKIKGKRTCVKRHKSHQRKSHKGKSHTRKSHKRKPHKKRKAMKNAGRSGAEHGRKAGRGIGR